MIFRWGFLLTLLWIPPAQAAEPIRFELQGETVEFKADGRAWTEGVRNDGGNKGLVQYLLPGEKVDNWTEILTVNYFQGLEQTGILERFVTFTKDGLYQQCSDIQWDPLDTAPNSVSYAWTAKGCKGWSDQGEIARVIKGEKALYVLHYATKQLPISKEKNREWSELFNKAKIKT